ncbi:MAG: uracil phosphoribosyltransferase [Spiroplasma sp.]|nr:uracil phosphoribosyltransferase [Spiroplasma sp.]
MAKENVFIINHPLILDKLTRIRNKNTEKKDFQENLTEIVSLMAYEVFKDIPLDSVSIETPIGKTKGKNLTKTIIICPILRAGLGMVNGLEHLLPNAIVSHIGLYRDEITLQPQEYFFKYPNVKNHEDNLVYVLDPMLATGGSTLAAIKKLKAIGVKNITFIGIVGVKEAINKVHKEHKDVKIYLAALDEKLDENGFIIPGLGDAGDRIFGTK